MVEELETMFRNEELFRSAGDRMKWVRMIANVLKKYKVLQEEEEEEDETQEACIRELIGTTHKRPRT